MSRIDQYDNPLFHRFEKDELETAETERFLRRIRERKADSLMPAVKRRAVHSPSYSIKELAERWGVCYTTVHSWISAGKLTGHKFGRGIRVNIEEVERFEIETKKEAVPTYSARDVATKLNVSIGTVRRWIKSGKLKAFRKLNTQYGHWYISQDEMDRISLKK